MWCNSPSLSARTFFDLFYKQVQLLFHCGSVLKDHLKLSHEKVSSALSGTGTDTEIIIPSVLKATSLAYQRNPWH
jgi:hypothetical protein